jgi:hypothetical protein
MHMARAGILKMRATPSLAPRLRPFAHLGAILLLALLAYSPHAAPQKQSPSKAKSSARIDLRPKLVPGQVRRYQVELQTITNTKSSGVVSDPQGPSRLAVTWDATIRLEVLGVAFAPGAETNPLVGPLRLRTTYEHSAAAVRSDSPDPQAENIEQNYKRLEGQVIEFTVATDGHVSDVRGLEGVIDDDQVRKAAEQWMAQVSGPAIAADGVAVGQSWNSAQPADSMPIAGMIWRSNSTYLRNEPCRPAESAPSDSPGEICAVILTRQSIFPRKQLRDPTPDDYRRNGLRTSGRWSGSGESLSYISLETHAAISVTQDSAQQIDFTVTNSSGKSIRYAGTIETHSRVALLRPAGSP